MMTDSISITTTTYGYDHLGQRVWKRAGTATTTYPSRYYDLLTTTGTATTTSYIHPDHLGSTNVLTSSTGTILHTLDYYPYGTERITSGTNQNNRHYIGEMYDSESSLSYLNARYYEGSRGQFLSQDPVFWEVGQTKDGRSALTNPQAQNSYSYAENNPLTKKDPDGRFVPQAMALGFAFGGIAGGVYQGISDFQNGKLSNFGTYGVAIGKGAVVGAAAAGNPFAAAGIAGGSSVLGSYLQYGRITGQDIVNAGVEGAVTGFTAGYLKSLPQVKGMQASNIFGSTYYTGAHAQRYAGEAAFGLGTQMITNNAQGISSNIFGGSSFSSLISSFQKAFQPTTSAQGDAVQKVITELNKLKK